MMEINHIGIVVKQLEGAITTFQRLLQAPAPAVERVTAQSARVAFFSDATPKIELLSPTNEDGVLSKFLEKRGEGIHHVAFTTRNIAKEVERLEAAGFAWVSPRIQQGAGGKKVCFLHPKGTHGVLIELCEA